jgi:uncharacterized repeat protein (TIGR01451 family)
MKTFLNTSMPLALFLAFLHLSEGRVLAQSNITAFAGSVEPFNGAFAARVSFVAPQSVLSDGSGGFYLVTSSPQHSVYHVAFVNTLVTLIAGNGSQGYSGDGGPAISAQLNIPGGIALDSSGNLYIADSGNHRVRKVTPQGVISTVAGTGQGGFSGDGGAATSARINYPRDLAVDGSGNLYIADALNYRIRKVTSEGVISTFAGIGTYGFSGDGGPALSASIGFISGLTVDGAGNLWMSDTNNHRIRKITSAGIISTVAGNGVFGLSGDGGPATSARLAGPQGLALDGSGNLLIADSGNRRIRRVNVEGTISTVFVTATSGPSDVAVEGGSGNLLVIDSNRIFRVSPSGTIISQAAGNGTFGFSGDGGQATSALLRTPAGLAKDAAGNLLIADSSNNRIRKVSPAGVISTFAGTGMAGFAGDGGPATSAQLNTPGDVAVGPDGSVYITDCSNRIRRVSPEGVITTFASSSLWNFCTYDYYDYYSYEPIARGGLVLDSHGNLFVASFNARIYKITPQGVISVVAGSTYGYSGDGGPATSARISEPWGMAMDSSDNLYIADAFNNRIRKVSPDGIITTVAGNGLDGFDGDGGPATSARLEFPMSVAVDTAGSLFIASAYRVRKMASDGIITSVAGNGTLGSSGDGGAPTSARLGYPLSIDVDSEGNLFISDSSNHRIRKVVFALTIPTLTSISPTFSGQGATVNVSLEGSSLFRPLAIDAGSSITVSNIRVLSEVQATATFTIASDAPLGTRNVNVTTNLGTSGNVSFNVMLPFPDVSITSSHTGNMGVGFNETFVIGIANVGTAATASAMTVTDTLPVGLTFVSATGIGWSCTASEQVVTCINPNPLVAGASTSLSLTVTVGGNAGSSVIHAPRVNVAGDPVSSNDTASDPTVVVFPPVINLSFTPANLLAASQARLNASVNQSFPHDVTGTMKLTFSPNVVAAGDDAAIQFATGGREVAFTIPANSFAVQFPSTTGFINFQTGTVAGTLSFSANVQTGTVQSTFSTSRVLPRQAPAILSVQREGASRGAFAVAIRLFSNPREVTQLILRFDTSAGTKAGCGTVAGCSASGNTLTLDVRSLFDAWFTANPASGSATTLRVPLSAEGTVQGSVTVSLRNAVGTSNTGSFLLP